jgi:signal transduction histidine kinase
VADDEKEDPALTANLSSLAQALPELLERFRAMARAVGGKDESALASSQPAQTIDLAAAMDQVLEAATAELAGRFSVLKLYAYAPPVLANDKQLAQMLMGHLVHAGQAVPPGRPDEHELQIRISTSEDGWARVELTLDGPSVHDGAGNSRLELPPVVAPKTELRA